MSNSKVVESRVSRSECVTCGWTEYDVREIVAVGDDQDEGGVGERYEQCRNCGETYDADTDAISDTTSTGSDQS